MATITTRLALCAALLAVAACARQPEPVTVAPTFNKMGDPVCPVGTQLATDAETGQVVCVDPTTL
jgi:hypothetical protein